MLFSQGRIRLLDFVKPVVVSGEERSLLLQSAKELLSSWDFVMADPIFGPNINATAGGMYRIKSSSTLTSVTQ